MSLPRLIIHALFLTVPLIVSAQQCPTISVEAPKTLLVPGEAYTFSVHLSGSQVSANLSFTWGASAGEIKDAWKPTIELIPGKSDWGKTITVFVKVDGLPAACQGFASEIADVTSKPSDPHPEEFSDFEPRVIRARVDSLFIVLNNNPTRYGVITIYFNVQQSRLERLRLLNRFRSALKDRRYDAGRVKFAFAEVDDKWGTRGEFWILFQDDEPKQAMKMSDLVVVSGKEVVASAEKALPKRQCLCKWK